MLVVGIGFEQLQLELDMVQLVRKRSNNLEVKNLYSIVTSRPIDKPSFVRVIEDARRCRKFKFLYRLWSNISDR